VISRCVEKALQREKSLFRYFSVATRVGQFLSSIVTGSRLMPEMARTSTIQKSIIALKGSILACIISMRDISVLDCCKDCSVYHSGHKEWIGERKCSARRLRNINCNQKVGMTIRNLRLFPRQTFESIVSRSQNRGFSRGGHHAAFSSRDPFCFQFRQSSHVLTSTIHLRPTTRESPSNRSSSSCIHGTCTGLASQKRFWAYRSVTCLS
jgi:hypothetical protein